MSGCPDWEERLSAHSLREFDAAAAAEVEAHLADCAGCRGLAGELGRLDSRLAASPAPALPDPAAERIGARLAARLAEEGPDPAADVMTLAEVARWLRVELEDVEAELHALPTFEFAGKLRIRRARLIEWIEARERRDRVSQRTRRIS